MVLLFSLLLLCFAASLLAILTNNQQLERVLDRIPLWQLPAILIALGILGLLPMELGAIARGEHSALPWRAYAAAAARHGPANGVFALISHLTWCIWAFVLPGHIYANGVWSKTGIRPASPYVINVVIGLLLSTPWNPIYRLIDAS